MVKKRNPTPTSRKCVPIPDKPDAELCIGMWVMFRAEVQSSYEDQQDVYVQPGDEAQVTNIWVMADGTLDGVEFRLASGESFQISDADTLEELGEVLVEVIPSARGVRSIDQADLDTVNAYRRKLGMRALDPVAQGWSADDVRLEAQRIRAYSNPKRVREELLAW